MYISIETALVFMFLSNHNITYVYFSERRFSGFHSLKIFPFHLNSTRSHCDMCVGVNVMIFIYYIPSFLK